MNLRYQIHTGTGRHARSTRSLRDARRTATATGGYVVDALTGRVIHGADIARGVHRPRELPHTPATDDLFDRVRQPAPSDPNTRYVPIPGRAPIPPRTAAANDAHPDPYAGFAARTAITIGAGYVALSDAIRRPDDAVMAAGVLLAAVMVGADFAGLLAGGAL